jgi:hypothetical protein
MLAVAAQAALIVAIVLDVRTIPYHAGLRAHSIGQFMGAFLSAAAWPVSGKPLMRITAAIMMRHWRYSWP